MRINLQRFFRNKKLYPKGGDQSFNYGFNDSRYSFRYIFVAVKPNPANHSYILSKHLFHAADEDEKLKRPGSLAVRPELLNVSLSAFSFFCYV